MPHAQKQKNHKNQLLRKDAIICLLLCNRTTVCPPVRSDTSLAFASELLLRTAEQILVYLFCTILASADLTYFGVFHSQVCV